MSARAAARGDEGGSTVVEAAVVVPVAMLIVLLAIQACLWVHAATLVENAAAVGIQAATQVGGSPTQASDRVDVLLSETGSHVVLSPNVSITRLPIDEVEVRISASAESILPGIRLPVSATRTGLVQEFRQSG
jgi:hypothetical protein